MRFTRKEIIHIKSSAGTQPTRSTHSLFAPMLVIIVAIELLRSLGPPLRLNLPWFLPPFSIPDGGTCPPRCFQTLRPRPPEVGLKLLGFDSLSGPSPTELSFCASVQMLCFGPERSFCASIQPCPHPCCALEMVTRFSSYVRGLPWQPSFSLKFM